MKTAEQVRERISYLRTQADVLRRNLEVQIQAGARDLAARTTAHVIDAEQAIKTLEWLFT